MIIKINLNLQKIKISENALMVGSIIHDLLGRNNKWHDNQIKEYSVSMIIGGVKDGEYIIFNNDSHIFVNTSNNEIRNIILENSIKLGYYFNIVFNIARKGENILTAKNIRYNYKGKNYNISEENKKDFEKYLKNKYGIDAVILKINKNIDVKYKNNSAIKSTNILFKIITDNPDDVQKLFETGIGGSTAIGFGFVDNININKHKDEVL